MLNKKVAFYFPLQVPPNKIAKYKGKYIEGWNTVRKKIF